MPVNNYFATETPGSAPAVFAFFSGSDILERGSLAMVSLSEFFSSLQVRLVTGIAVLSLLLIVGVIFLFLYRKRFLIFSKKCSELQSELKKNRRELTCMQGLLVQKSMQHREMLDGAGAAIFELSAEGDCVYANAAMGVLIGVEENSLLGGRLTDVVHPDDREKMDAVWGSFASREPPFEFSYRLLRKDGGVVHVMERGSQLLNRQKEISGYFGQVVDATQPLLDVEAARRAEWQSNWFVGQISDGFYKLTLNEPLDVNASKDLLADQIYQTARLAACTSDLAVFYGQSTENMVGTPLKMLPGGCGFFGGPDDIRRFVESDYYISGAEGVRNDQNGTPVYLSYQMVGVIEKDRLVAIWGTQQDITLQKREQQKAQDREDLLRRILDGLPGDVYVKDPRFRYLYVNQALENRTGIPVDDWMGKTIFELMPAAPRDINELSIDAMKSGRLCRRVDSSVNDGQQRWMETIEAPLVSSDGVMEGVVGISIDVTDRTLRELSLQKSEEQFRGMVKNCPTAVMLCDAGSGVITYANPAFCELFGYIADEIPGLKVDDLHVPGSRRHVREMWDEHARQSEFFEEVLACQRKDKVTVFADVGVALGTFDGTEKVIAVYRDAAARKKTETELEQQRDRQVALLRNASVLAVLVDLDGVIRSVNDAVLELLRLDESDVVGKPYAETLVYENDRVVIKEALAEQTPGFQNDCEIRLVSGGGPIHTMECRIRALVDPFGEVDGFSVTGLDVTQLRKTEQQLRKECGEISNRLLKSEFRVSSAMASCQEAETQKEELTKRLQKIEEQLASRNDEFEEVRAKNENQAARLTETIKNLEIAKADVEKKAIECRALDEKLKITQNEFNAEKERTESMHAAQVKGLEETIYKFCDQEEELKTECSKLKESLSEMTQQYQTIKEEARKERVVWKAEEALQSTLQQKMKKNAREQAHRLHELTIEHAEVQEELATARKELAAEHKSVQHQVKQNTAALQKEIKQLLADKKHLTAELKKSEARLAELT